MQGICSVCWINNKDDSIKEVTWCERCKRYKCASCRKSIVKSGKAFARNLVRKVTSEK